MNSVTHIDDEDSSSKIQEWFEGMPSRNTLSQRNHWMDVRNLRKPGSAIFLSNWIGNVNRGTKPYMFFCLFISFWFHLMRFCHIHSKILWECAFFLFCSVWKKETSAVVKTLRCHNWLRVRSCICELQSAFLKISTSVKECPEGIECNFLTIS